ncbi:tetratricopeptide repeat protein [Aquisphaera insulae]|uniref:tetratricopeptide repeat protein n=1 Tax=Aquisphaera insulae TaxID=2712864 RepID=UPI0013EDEABA|nr:tetratricopeptide repeat protein [Aquisphaera insulae]
MSRRQPRSASRPRPSPSSPKSSATKAATTAARSGARWWKSRRAILGAVAAGGLLLALALFLVFVLPADTKRRRAGAEALAKAGDWKAAREAWREINRSPRPDAASYLGEARACLAQGLAGQAEGLLRRAAMADPAAAEPWLLLLEILRVEDRPAEALEIGRQILDALDPASRRELLRELTLAALTEVPDDIARSTLRRWIDADPFDADARVALIRRIAADPRGDDPDRDVRLAELERLAAAHPDHLASREALITALADAGEVDRGRALLDSWPAADRSRARYQGLLGRWELDIERRPERAAEALSRALAEAPHDWRGHYRLARAYQALNRPEDARLEAEAVRRIRELLDPLTLAPQLESALAKPGDPASARTLATLCGRAGLARLADAWRALPPDPTAVDRLAPQRGLESR